MGEKIILIDRLAFGGEGVGRSEGKVVFVPWTVPGDLARVDVISDHGTYERAELVEVLEASPDRVRPSCDVYGRCGGCQWQHVDYAAQLKWKREILAETLRRVGRVPEPRVLDVWPSPSPWNYRKRIQVKVDASGRIGFYAIKSHHVIPFEDCKIADSLLNRKLDQIRRAPEPPEHSFELSLDGKGDEPQRVSVVDEACSETVFSQINPPQNSRLVAAVVEFSFGNAESAFTRKKTVVELYAGSGNFSFPVSERAGSVICVESNAKAVEAAEEETAANGIDNIEWVRGTSEWGLTKVLRRKIKVDVLILDPPRRGAKEILDLLCVLRPRVIVYVSCDPVTLARDVGVLTKRYYRLDKVQPVDMFPQTYHIESVTRLVLLPDDGSSGCFSP